jgi:hypothetical protein
MEWDGMGGGERAEQREKRSLGIRAIRKKEFSSGGRRGQGVEESLPPFSSVEKENGCGGIAGGPRKVGARPPWRVGLGDGAAAPKRDLPKIRLMMLASQCAGGWWLAAEVG